MSDEDSPNTTGPEAARRKGRRGVALAVLAALSALAIVLWIVRAATVMNPQAAERELQRVVWEKYGTPKRRGGPYQTEEFWHTRFELEEAWLDRRSGVHHFRLSHYEDWLGKMPMGLSGGPARAPAVLWTKDFRVFRDWGTWHVAEVPPGEAPGIRAGGADDGK
jgi:hypothetical protein